MSAAWLCIAVYTGEFCRRLFTALCCISRLLRVAVAAYFYQMLASAKTKKSKRVWKGGGCLRKNKVLSL